MVVKVRIRQDSQGHIRISTGYITLQLTIKFKRLEKREYNMIKEVK
jgi:hypothetical protein